MKNMPLNQHRYINLKFIIRCHGQGNVFLRSWERQRIKKKTGKPSSWLSQKKIGNFVFRKVEVKVIMLLAPVKSSKVKKLKLKQEY